MKLLKQSTAAIIVVGPVLDSSGAAVTTAVVGDFRIAKNGTTATLSGATVTHDANGYYTIALTTGNTDTVGQLVVYSGNPAQSMATHHWTVLLASVFDALQANATNATGGLVTATAAVTAMAGAITTPPTVGLIADAVWDEAYAGHTTAGTFGKLMDTLRKSNNVLEGTILASPTPTQTVFRISGADYPTGALKHAVLWMESGASQEQNSPILTTINNGDGTLTITLEEALVTAPSAGDTVLIDPTSHVHAIAAIQTGLATLANQVVIAGYLDTEIAAIKAVTDKLNTGLVADGDVWQFTVNMLELAPAGGGGGGSGDATEANQLLILNQLDDIQSKTDLISGASGITSLLAGAVLEPGTITSFPEVITIGDSYTEENGRAIQVPIVDTDGNPISSSGALYFADALVTFTISRANETETSRIVYGTAAVIDPPGTGTGDEAPYVLLELSSSETAKGLKKYRYTGVLKFTWPGTGTNVVSFETATEITFDN